MPRLLLFRHATAERATSGQTDHERALTKGGREESKAIGKILAARGETIDLVLSSDSERTRETWQYFAKKFGGEPEVRFLRALFEASDYLPIIKAEGGDAATLMVVGHNPAMQSAALAVAESLHGEPGSILRFRFPKGSLAIFDFEGDWAGLRPHQMRLVDFIEADI